MNKSLDYLIEIVEYVAHEPRANLTTHPSKESILNYIKENPRICLFLTYFYLRSFTTISSYGMDITFHYIVHFANKEKIERLK